MRGLTRTDVVETLRLGDVTAQVLRHRAGSAIRHTVRFAPSGIAPERAVGFQPDELADLFQAIRTVSEKCVRRGWS